MLIARIFPSPAGARKNTTQLAKYPRVLYDKPSNKMYLLLLLLLLVEVVLVLLVEAVMVEVAAAVALVVLYWGLLQIYC